LRESCAFRIGLAGAGYRSFGSGFKLPAGQRRTVMARYSRPIEIPRVGGLIRLRILAIPFCTLLGLAAAARAAPLPPVPDADFLAFASVQADNGVVNKGGRGFFRANATGIFHGIVNMGVGRVFGKGRPEENNGLVPFGKVAAFASVEGDSLCNC